MTATQAPMTDRLRAAMPADILDALSQVVVVLTVSILDIKDEATTYDYGTAVENLMDSLIGPEAVEIESDFRGKPRPETDDTRPLYLRVEDSVSPETARMIRTCWSKLNLMALTINDVNLALEFVETIVKPFAEALGVPSRSEYDRNPDGYAKVRPNAHVDALIEAAKAASASQARDVSNDYRLGR